MQSSRRVVLHPRIAERYRNLLREARADLYDMHFRHLCELEDLRVELRELKEILSLLVTLRRQQAEGDLDALQRQLETALARIERDPNKPLH